MLGRERDEARGLLAFLQSRPDTEAQELFRRMRTNRLLFDFVTDRVDFDII
jgi:hypothetical protein